MSGPPDPKPVRQEKTVRRHKDRLTVKQAKLANRECWGCGREGADGHHLIPKDFTKPGPDLAWNIVSLCGSGTSGCHGAFHGNPYVVGRLRITPTYVRARIVRRLLDDRPRLLQVLDFLDASTLQEQFFGRVLGMLPADIDEIRRRYV